MARAARAISTAVPGRSVLRMTTLIISSRPDTKRIASESQKVVESPKPKQLVADLQPRVTRARYVPEVDAIVETVARDAKDGDVVLVMSNGGFGGIHQKLLQALGR